MYIVYKLVYNDTYTGLYLVYILAIRAVSGIVKSGSLQVMITILSECLL